MNKKWKSEDAVVFLSQTLDSLAQLRGELVRGQEATSSEMEKFDFETTDLNDHDKMNIENFQSNKDCAFSRAIKQVTRISLVIAEIIDDLRNGICGKSVPLLIEELQGRLEQVHHPLAKSIDSCLHEAKEKLS